MEGQVSQTHSHRINRRKFPGTRRSSVLTRARCPRRGTIVATCGRGTWSSRVARRRQANGFGPSNLILYRQKNMAKRRTCAVLFRCARSVCNRYILYKKKKKKSKQTNKHRRVEFSIPEYSRQKSPPCCPEIKLLSTH
jgi:hypothetical protein